MLISSLPESLLVIYMIVSAPADMIIVILDALVLFELDRKKNTHNYQ